MISPFRSLLPALFTCLVFVGCSNDEQAPSVDVNEATSHDSSALSSANSWQLKSAPLECNDGISARVNKSSRRHVYAFAGEANQDVTVSLDGEWPWWMGSVAIVSDDNGNVLAQKIRHSSSSAKVSVTLESAGNYYVWVSPYEYTSVTRTYGYTLSSACSSPSCSSDAECNSGERCALPMCIMAPCNAPGTCVASPVCAEYTTADGRFYAKNFAAGSYADAKNWVTLDPDMVSSRVRNGVCDGQISDGCDPNAPVCGAPIYADQFSTFDSLCSFEDAVRQNAGTVGESKGKFTEGACAPVCDYTDPHRNYVAQSPETCMVVKFACTVGWFGFADACGCGCTDIAP